MTKPVTFKQPDLTRALKGVEKAGLTVAKIEIDRDGRIVIVPEGSSTPKQNDWDE